MVWPDDFVSKVICGDCLEVLRQIPDEVVHCIVTSPPYWGLRDYGTAKWEGGSGNCKHQIGRSTRGGYEGTKQSTSRGSGQAGEIVNETCPLCGARRIDSQLGLEKTPEDYVGKLVEIFHEVKRVLRRDGTLWLNLGDSYAGSNSDKSSAINPNSLSYKAGHTRGGVEKSIRSKVNGLKPKDLVGIPWRVAFALQANGWWLRSDIIWSKPNPMPESARDRPTRSHEYIFLLTKSEKYFFDQVAVRELANYDGRKDTYMKGSQKYSQPAVPGQAAHTFALRGHERWPHKLEDGSYGRNIRSVWTMTTKPFKEAHFATFPAELPERCIKAGTSEKGVCPKCGNPWVRIIKQLRSFESGSGKSGNPIIGKQNAIQGGGETLDIRRGPCVSTSTIGWRPSCNCNAGDPIPAIVLDPFVGAGTTCYVAKELRRNYIGIDLKREYCDMAEKRMVQGVL